MHLERATIENENWSKLYLQWEKECSDFGENFTEYASTSLPVLDTLARGTQLANAGVYLLSNETGFTAACQANVTELPGYVGKVLRLRHIVFSPSFDYSEDTDISEYGDLLVGIFTGAVALSYDEMKADHIKFHLRSPAELTFGNLFTKALKDHDGFTNSVMKGAWIYLSKT